MKFINENETKNLCGIYKITQKSTGRVYIGQTKMKFKKRYWHHKWKLNNGRHDNKFLQNAWIKYGEDDFEFEVIESIDRNDDMNEKEIMYINKYDSYHNGFNLTVGGDGKKGCPMPEHSKRIVGEKNRIKISGRKHNEETKRKMSISQLNRNQKLTSEHMEKLRQSRLGTKHNDSSKRKMREAKLGVGSAINTSQAYEIKRRLVNGEKIIDIANVLDIEYYIVKSILQEKAWTHIEVAGWDNFITEYKKDKKKILTDDQVRDIRNLINKGYSASEISKISKIGVSVVYGIKQNRTYKNVK
jgi:group I intron endonuclease